MDYAEGRGKGLSLAFHVRLHEKSWEEELDPMIEGIRSGTVPQRWLITPDATPWNVILLLESKGFWNLSSQAEKPEPGMLLHKNDFQPYFPADGDMICRRVRTQEDFRIWVDVVNTALHNPDRGYGVFGICFHLTGIPQEESGNFAMLAGTGGAF